MKMGWGYLRKRAVGLEKRLIELEKKVEEQDHVTEGICIVSVGGFLFLLCMMVLKWMLS